MIQIFQLGFQQSVFVFNSHILTNDVCCTDTACNCFTCSFDWQTSGINKSYCSYSIYTQLSVRENLSFHWTSWNFVCMKQFDFNWWIENGWYLRIRKREFQHSSKSRSTSSLTKLPLGGTWIFIGHILSRRPICQRLYIVRLLFLSYRNIVVVDDSSVCEILIRCRFEIFTRSNIVQQFPRRNDQRNVIVLSHSHQKILMNSGQKD